MNRLMAEWAQDDAAWTGDWRKAYMDEETEKKSKLIAMHDLWFYSGAWMQAMTHPRLVGAMVDLLGPNVELHHSTMHVKPPQTGHPFPMHQDTTLFTSIRTTAMSMSLFTWMTPATTTGRSGSWMDPSSRAG
jgi:phytanoyl-CoA hydroxylase